MTGISLQVALYLWVPQTQGQSVRHRRNPKASGVTVFPSVCVYACNVWLSACVRMCCTGVRWVRKPADACLHMHV